MTQKSNLKGDGVFIPSRRQAARPTAIEIDPGERRQPFPFAPYLLAGRIDRSSSFSSC